MKTEFPYKKISETILSIDVTLSDSTLPNSGWEGISVHVGLKEIGKLMRKQDSINWFAESKQGPEDLHEILGEDPSYVVMAKRLLAHRLYIPEPTHGPS